MIPIGENPDGDLRSLTVDASDYLQVALSDLGGSVGMGEPKGLLITPIAYNPDGDLRSLELDASDYLLVTVLGGSDDEILASDGTRGAWESLASVLKSALLTANGDLLVRNGSGVVTRLPAGLANEILGLGAGIPTWEAGSKKTLTALGDLLFASASNALARRAIGSTDEVLTVVGGAPAWAAIQEAYIECARANSNAPQTIPTAEWTTLLLAAERYDTDNIHDLLTNTGRLTCKTAGKYMINAQMEFGINNTGRRLIRIRHNDTTNIAVNEFVPLSGTTSKLFTATQWNMAVDDYVEFGCYQNSGGDLDTISSSALTVEFMMSRVG